VNVAPQVDEHSFCHPATCSGPAPPPMHTGKFHMVSWLQAIRVRRETEAEVEFRRSTDADGRFRDLGNSIAESETRMKRVMEKILLDTTRSGKLG
jgi:hypothetical protein